MTLWRETGRMNVGKASRAFAASSYGGETFPVEETFWELGICPEQKELQNRDGEANEEE